MNRFIVIFGALSLLLTACGQEQKEIPKQQSGEQTKKEESATKSEKGAISSNPFFEPFNGNIDHVHGLGYAGNQNAIFFAAHDGLKVYENHKWLKTKKENNDYMGFNATEKGFYSSGHPGADSSLPNPIGIKRSTNNGEALENIGLEGETDFHSMGVGYYNNVIFVLNPDKNSLMEANTFYLSEDNGKTWTKVQAQGLTDEVINLAVHPNDEMIVAVAGKKGIYLSKDKGESFEQINSEGQGTTVFFSDDSLWYGSFSGTPSLAKQSLTDGSKENIALPEMEEDGVLYFAQNPQNDQEMAFVSFKGDIYHTSDGAKNWKLLVREGKLQ